LAFIGFAGGKGASGGLAFGATTIGPVEGDAITAEVRPCVPPGIAGRRIGGCAGAGLEMTDVSSPEKSILCAYTSGNPRKIPLINTAEMAKVFCTGLIYPIDIYLMILAKNTED
jgi:hypothetical protein